MEAPDAAPPVANRGKIVRRPLREAVHAELLDWIWRGAVAPGARLSDFAVAADLGVSRTPVREALLRLHREGVVEADPGRGFVVKPLSVREVRDLYPILWTLECLALRLSPPLDAGLSADLSRINRELGRARDPEALIELDARWHATLLRGCPNEPLLELIRSLRERLRRYEHAYMRGLGRVELSTRQHERIASALKSGDVAGAARWLERNWRISLDSLTAWLEPSQSPLRRPYGAMRQPVGPTLGERQRSRPPRKRP